jgi:hypothetical protein
MSVSKNIVFKDQYQCDRIMELINQEFAEDPAQEEDNEYE